MAPSALALQLLPPLLLALLVPLATAWLAVMPEGTTSVLVRLSALQPEATLIGAAAAGAALVSVPAPGYAVLHGDAAHIRRHLGLAVSWTGGPPCAAR